MIKLGKKKKTESLKKAEEIYGKPENIGAEELLEADDLEELWEEENPDDPVHTEEGEAVDDEGGSSTHKKAKKPKKNKKRLFGRKVVSNDIVRIEKLEEMIRKEDLDDVDAKAIVSMYMPHRKARNFGAALLRLDRMYLILLGMILAVALLFIIAFMQEKMGNFTINLNRLELFRKGVAIDSNGEFSDPTARLTADTVSDATNISIDDLPENLDDLDGEHNGKNYMAYTYYVRNAGKEDLGYIASIVLSSSAKGAEDAVRVAVWRNGERIVYAEPSSDGTPEAGCENFKSRDIVCSMEETDFKVGYVNKYTIVIWLEGDDPECVDAIVGGSVEFAMNIDADYDDETNLFVKFVQDIQDTLFGEKPISASGNDAPDYFNDEEITWKNRRNKQ